MKNLIALPDILINDLVCSINRGCICELKEESADGRERVFIQKGHVASIGGLRVHIYSDEHPPPHFHVKYGCEENSFSIEDARPLHPDGDLKKWFKNIKKWHSKNHELIIDFWNKTRSWNCAVGPVVLPKE